MKSRNGQEAQNEEQTASDFTIRVASKITKKYGGLHLKISSATPENTFPRSLPPGHRRKTGQISGEWKGKGMRKCQNLAQKLREFVAMESQVQEKVYFHYNHTDSCKDSRWTAKESYEFMYARPWGKVLDFYSNVVNGRMSLGGLFGTEAQPIHDDSAIIEASDDSELVSVSTEERKGRWARTTFKIVLSYQGSSFDGWQKQPELNTVQGLVERLLGNFVDEKKAQVLKEKGLPKEGCAVVAGRTDKGVTALQQVCSFYTWRNDVKAEHIIEAINEAASGQLRVRSVTKVSRAFHPNFSAKWRRYFYIFPLNNEEEEESVQTQENDGNSEYSDNGCRDELREQVGWKNKEYVARNNSDELEGRIKPTRFRISKVNQLLHQLEGKLLSYKMFARDTKASRNVGPPTECFVFRARATEAALPCTGKDDGCTKVMCVELVANRFLRKMVRVLVATSIREAAAGAEDDALIKLMDATCRRATAPPAPPHGLCLVDVGYKEFDPSVCLIP